MRCLGCGAELELGPARCPLCGAEASLTSAKRREPPNIDDYQLRIRTLREQLKRLRDGEAEAV
jgi:predicted amidophosphoribosyltransferase